MYLFQNVTTPQPPSGNFDCLSGACVPSAGGGVPKDVCERACIGPDTKYVCDHNQCVVSADPSKGANKTTCEEICG